MIRLTPAQKSRAFIANKITPALIILEALKQGKKNITKKVVLRAIKDLKEAVKFIGGA